MDYRSLSRVEVKKIIDSFVEKKSLENNKEYAREYFLSNYEGIDHPQNMDFENFWWNFRDEVQETGKISDYSISYHGIKKARKYIFQDIPSKSEYVSPSVPLEVPNQILSNDNPEDRSHLYAHVALLFQKGALAVSLPKKTGGKVNDNPDMIGLHLVSYSNKNDSTVIIPNWMSSEKKKNIVIVFGCEVKPYLFSDTDIYNAIVEARHNSRYFDQAWLLSQIHNDKIELARELGEEYNVGVISWNNIWPSRSDVVWQPSSQKSTKNNIDYFSRESVKSLSLLTTIEQLYNEIKDEAISKKSQYALKAFFTDQDLESLIRRLPISIRDVLKSGNNGEDPSIQAFVNLVEFIFMDSYQEFADNDESISGYLQKSHTDMYDYLSKGSHRHLSTCLQKKLKETLADFAKNMAADSNELSDFLLKLK